jgi:hypothetical protein
MAWSPPAHNAGIVWVSAPGDYATFNSNHTPDGTKRTLLDGVCPEVAELLKDKSVDTEVFSLLRKMKPMRQIEAVPRGTGSDQ